MTTYHASGKLLITGEYVVLRGAKALSLPTRPGQSLSVDEGKQGLEWTAKTPDGSIWFHVIYSADGDILQTDSKESAGTLRKILYEAFMIGGIFPFGGFSVTTQLEFDPSWGLGSSSTLIVLIAKWMKVDPMRLFFRTLEGSGYDVACGWEKKPILYRLSKDDRPEWETIHWQPLNPSDWHFVYLGEKKKSAVEVLSFREIVVSDEELHHFSSLTEDLIHAKTAQQYPDILNEHEDRLSRILQRKRVKEERFPDFEGCIKSLGAWGGDFILALHQDPLYIRNYFHSKNLSIIQSFREIILG
ncbi:MAG: GHMP kinase [Bacteroidota bacterium]|nr:GHMP kinase [Bacteroidota bacterium]MDX5427791.1 GHMP kinase [Bacteroidota bacterium]MDX5505670.1 GHMP kinase [Bacteroidota bacterium]